MGLNTQGSKTSPVSETLMYVICSKPTRDNGRQLYADFVGSGHSQRRRPDCACEGEHSEFIATGTAVERARENGPEPGNEHIVREEDCDPQLFPHGHWNRVARDRDVVTWNSTGHRMMYGSIAVQHAIWRHQHPRSCNAKKFLVYKMSGRGNGIGALLHKTTIMLQAALDLNRILVLYPQPGGQWLDAPFCLGTSTLDSCYFEPISSCSIRDAMRHRKWEAIPWLDPVAMTKNSARTLKDECNRISCAVLFWRTTPLVFHELLKQGNIPTTSYYWWRAQGVAYLVRPNARTLKTLHRRRVEIFQNASIEEGVLSVHVRHGDKWKESAVAADEAYLASAEAVVRGNPGSVKRSIFLSTEDANTVRFFSGLSNWTVRWTNVTRWGSDSHWNSTEEFATMVGWDAEFLNSLLSLQLALDCTAWVGMLSSNWNRLVDELRSTIRCKYDRPYVDVFHGTNINNYYWR